MQPELYVVHINQQPSNGRHRHVRPQQGVSTFVNAWTCSNILARFYGGRETFCHARYDV
jgi:hypothetical protein